MKEILASKGEVILVDDEDFDELSKYSWSIHKSGMPQRAGEFRDGKAAPIKMNRQLMGLVTGDGLAARYRDGNTLDNRRSNLYVTAVHSVRCAICGNPANRAIHLPADNGKPFGHAFVPEGFEEPQASNVARHKKPKIA